MFVYLFGFLFWSLLGGAAGAWWSGLGGAGLGAWLGGMVWVLQQLWRAHRLEAWFRTGPQGEPPRLAGLWREVSDRIRRVLRLREQQVQTHAERLQRYLQAIQASPNGVTLLDSEGRIEWCNSAASQHLGIDAQRDLGQHVVHLVREPVFSRYFHQASHDGEIQMDGRSASLSQRVKLSVQLYPYGDGQQLLLSRDITAMAQADSMRRDFVANVSHEIRTPLTVLAGFVETLQSLPLEPADRQHYLDLMAVQASRMQSLVQDLLTLSQLEGSPPPGPSEQIDLLPFMRQIEADAQALSVLQGQTGLPVHQLVFAATPSWCLLGARTELHSAVSNLVSNAVRYTPVGGRIEVSWQEQGEELLMAVRDTGPGIAPEHLPRLSERFYRVDRSRSRETGGTGLGLAITKHVAQRHGGALRIESQLGVGSTFLLVLPLSRRVQRSD
jgi:two-component system, OmpR family, phosphate regulon sensor histidine kinase PhoR